MAGPLITDMGAMQELGQMAQAKPQELGVDGPGKYYLKNPLWDPRGRLKELLVLLFSGEENVEVKCK